MRPTLMFLVLPLLFFMSSFFAPVVLRGLSPVPCGSAATSARSEGSLTRTLDRRERAALPPRLPPPRITSEASPMVLDPDHPNYDPEKLLMAGLSAGTYSRGRSATRVGRLRASTL